MEEKSKFVENRGDSGDEGLIDEEIVQSFEEDQQRDYGAELLKRRLAEHTEESPKLAGGDVDADWETAATVGEEAVGGSVATPDQDVVDELGEAVGLTYSDTEPLHTDDKLRERERNRWHLDPASDPEFPERIKEEFKKEPPKAAPKRKKASRKRKPL